MKIPAAALILSVLIACGGGGPSASERLAYQQSACRQIVPDDDLDAWVRKLLTSPKEVASELRTALAEDREQKLGVLLRTAFDAAASQLERGTPSTPSDSPLTDVFNVCRVTLIVSTPGP